MTSDTDVSQATAEAPRRRPHASVIEGSVAGTVLVGGMIVVTGTESASSWETLLSVVATLFVFWIAHVYAGAVAAYGTAGGHAATFSAALRRSLRNSVGFATSAVLPSIVLLLGATHVVSDEVAIWVALWLGVIVLGVVGYGTFAARGSSWPIRIVGCLSTAAFGLILIVMKALVH